MDRWSVGLDVVADLVTDFLSEALDEKARKLQHEGLEGSSGRSVQAQDCGPDCWTPEERLGSSVDQPAVGQINEDSMIDEKIRTQDWTSDLGDPERL